MSELRILFLRHGEVASHRGDVPVTEGGLAHAELSGKALAASTESPFTVLYGGTRRTSETARALIRGIGDPSRVDGPYDSFALRNPDLYAAGTRVNMVSSADALAEPVPGMTAEQAESLSWWTTFFSSPDRVGWWLSHSDPPGETRGDLMARLTHFATSLADPGPHTGRLVVCVTHSPLVRTLVHSATGADPGEPPYVTGAELVREPDGRLRITAYDPQNAEPTES